jgi:hypothetical protein
MTDIEKFLTSLPEHMKPQTDTERLLMVYAWYEGHTEGLKLGLAHHSATLLRIVPRKEIA